MTKEEYEKAARIADAKVKAVLAAAKQEIEEQDGDFTYIANLERSYASEYGLPFELFPHQKKELEWIVNRRKSGIFWDPGTGKTAAGAALAFAYLAKRNVKNVVIIVPPILIDQWADFLRQAKGVKEEDVLAYRGTPTQRRKLEPSNHKFVILSSAIFRNDFEKLNDAFGDNTFVIRDEAHDIKNVETRNYKLFSKFIKNRYATLLTGTPLSTPEDAYSYMSMLAPTIYKTKGRFMRLHAGDRDFFNNVISWERLDMLKKNMADNTSRVLIGDVLKDLPEIRYTPMPYQLEPKHWKLYQQLAEEQFLEIGDGKIDATTAQALYHNLGQIICNYEYFSDGAGRSTCFDIVDQTLDELHDQKLIVFSYYRRTSEAMLEYLQPHGAVAVYGGQTAKQNKAAADRFKTDPTCRVIVIQPSSGGVGLDGLQDVCRNGLFLEMPSMREFIQAVARLHRSGQKNAVNIRIAYAQKTLQVKQFRTMLNRDETVNKVVRNKADLRKVIFGEDDD